VDVFDDSMKVAPQPKRLHDEDLGTAGETNSVDDFRPESASDFRALVACCQEIMGCLQRRSKDAAPFEPTSPRQGP
jgi:hypothetical protein